jgi:hypothetical protein
VIAIPLPQKASTSESYPPAIPGLISTDSNPRHFATDCLLRRNDYSTSIILDTTYLKPGSIGGTMVTAMVSGPPYALSYHTNFQNTTLTTLDPNLSVSSLEGHTSFATITGGIDFEETLDTPTATVLSGHTLGPVLVLSTANSIVVQSPDLGRELPSVYTTAVDPIETNSVFDLPVWAKGSDSVATIVTSLEQEGSTNLYTSLTRCALAGYYTIIPSLCSILNSGSDGTTAQYDSLTNSGLTLGTLNHTTIGFHSGIHEPFTSAALDSGYYTDQANTETSKLGGHDNFDNGQGDFTAAATAVPSGTVSCQTLAKSLYEETNASATPPPTAVTGLTRSLNGSLAPQITSRTLGPWNPTSLPNTDTRTEVAANGSLPVPDTPPSAPPTFSSAGNVATSHYMMVLVCLWALTAVGDWDSD